MLATAVLALYATVDLSLDNHLLLAGALVAVGYGISRRFPDLRVAVAYLSVAVSLRYLVWRATYTLSLLSTEDLVFAWTLYFAEVYGFVIMVLGYVQTAVLRPRVPVPLPADPSALPLVDVYIPTFDESVDVVRRTLVGATSMRYPNKRIYLLDDGRRDAMRRLAEDLGVEYLTRPDNEFAKAGNINAALRRTTGELVAIFDCDHVPVCSFLDVTVGLLVRDPGLALVQTPHHFYNPDPVHRNLWLEGKIPPEQAMFYHAVQIGNDFWNSVLFCGSCAVLRRAALEDIGGIARETVTEDAHTSLRLMERGWRSAYLDVPQAAGLATERYAHHVAQRLRWARGMTQILRLDNPLLKGSLSIPQRLAYLNAILHFQFGIPRLIFLLAPPLYIIGGLHPLEANPWHVLAFAAPHIALSFIGAHTSSRSMRHAFWAEVYEIALAPFTALVTTLALVAPRRGKFNVTVKDTLLDRAHFDWRYGLPNVLLLGLSVYALVLTPERVLRAPLEADTLLITAILAAYNVVLLLAAVGVAFERPQQRKSPRVERSFTASVFLPGEASPRHAGRTVDLSESGIALDLAAGVSPPGEVDIVVDPPGGATPRLRARLVGLVPGRSGHPTRATFTFAPLPRDSHHAVLRAMFSEPDSWLVSPAPRSWFGALVDVIGAPWRAVASTLRRDRAVRS